MSLRLPPSGDASWLHHLALIIAGDVQAPGLFDPAGFVFYFVFLVVWSLLLWFVRRRRDVDAAADKQLEQAAAEKALRCRSLVDASEHGPGKGRGAP